VGGELAKNHAMKYLEDLREVGEGMKATFKHNEVGVLFGE
jgi:hypothetical protein